VVAAITITVDDQAQLRRTQWTEPVQDPLPEQRGRVWGDRGRSHRDRQRDRQRRCLRGDRRREPALIAAAAAVGLAAFG
jgi:hypothetical protein